MTRRRIRKRWMTEGEWVSCRVERNRSRGEVGRKTFPRNTISRRRRGGVGGR